MDNPEADVVMKKEDVPMEGDDCWDKLKAILCVALQEEGDDDEIKIDKLRHQIDRDVEGRGYKRFVRNSQEWMELQADWMDEQPSRRRKFARQITKHFQSLMRKKEDASKVIELQFHSLASTHIRLSAAAGCSWHMGNGL